MRRRAPTLLEIALDTWHEPLTWYARKGERRRKKLPIHARIWRARWKRKHQRFVLLSIRIKRAIEVMRPLLDSFEEYDVTIREPQTLLNRMKQT